MWFNRPFFDPDMTCRAFELNRESETMVHELGHLFRMGHVHQIEQYGGVPISKPLTFTFGLGYGDSDEFLTLEDLDNIGCVFPQPDFAR